MLFMVEQHNFASSESFWWGCEHQYVYIIYIIYICISHKHILSINLLIIVYIPSRPFLVCQQVEELKTGPHPSGSLYRVMACIQRARWATPNPLLYVPEKDRQKDPNLIKREYHNPKDLVCSHWKGHYTGWRKKNARGRIFQNMAG